MKNSSGEPNAKLLIVDDEAAQMKALCDTLNDQGYRTTGFTSAREALKRLQTESFDLLLTDLAMMPEMDGIEFLRSAREVDPNLVGIVMTGHGTVDTAVESMKVGALDYILKPFKLSVILPVIARALAVRRLRIANEQLQQSIHERTAQLEAANKGLETFSYSVSHDLRAPLRGIDGFSQILLQTYESLLPEDGKVLLRKVRENTRYMQKLIEDLLNFSRLGRQTLSKQPVNMVGLAREVVDSLQAEQQGRSVEIKIGELPEGLGDYALLKQVFVNLLANALKFTRGRERAVIEVGFEAQDGETVYFVRDNGAGFDMQYVDKIFGVFQRLHRADEFEGTGIGLSIVQQIIQRHGGRVWAEGEVDKGATIRFTLPPE